MIHLKDTEKVPPRTMALVGQCRVVFILQRCSPLRTVNKQGKPENKAQRGVGRGVLRSLSHGKAESNPEIAAVIKEAHLGSAGSNLEDGREEPSARILGGYEESRLPGFSSIQKGTPLSAS